LEKYGKELVFFSTSTKELCIVVGAWYPPTTVSTMVHSHAFLIITGQHLKCKVPASTKTLINLKCKVPASTKTLINLKCKVPASTKTPINLKCKVPASTKTPINLKCKVPLDLTF
jgi:hypothetical protein